MFKSGGIAMSTQGKVQGRGCVLSLVLFRQTRVMRFDRARALVSNQSNSTSTVAGSVAEIIAISVNV